MGDPEEVRTHLEQVPRERTQAQAARELLLREVAQDLRHELAMAHQRVMRVERDP